MKIRAAMVEDVPAVLPMVTDICAMHKALDPARYGFLENPAQMYRNWLGRRAEDERSVFLVAEDDGKLVGFLVGTVEREIPIYQVREFGFVHDLWVRATHRRKGIGRQMMMQAVERFRAMGVEQIRLDTAAGNQAAQGLFGACGFRPSTMQMLVEIKEGK